MVALLSTTASMPSRRSIPKHEHRLHPDPRRSRRARLGRIGRRRLRQRARRVVRRQLQDRADRRPCLADPLPARARHRRIHQLVQQRPPAREPRLPAAARSEQQHALREATTLSTENKRGLNEAGISVCGLATSRARGRNAATSRLASSTRPRSSANRSSHASVRPTILGERLQERGRWCDSKRRAIDSRHVLPDHCLSLITEHAASPRRRFGSKEEPPTSVTNSVSNNAHVAPKRDRDGAASGPCRWSQ